jgi:hypothetical protein
MQDDGRRREARVGEKYHLHWPPDRAKNVEFAPLKGHPAVAARGRDTCLTLDGRSRFRGFTTKDLKTSFHHEGHEEELFTTKDMKKGLFAQTADLYGARDDDFRVGRGCSRRNRG